MGFFMTTEEVYSEVDEFMEQEKRAKCNSTEQTEKHKTDDEAEAAIAEPFEALKHKVTECGGAKAEVQHTYMNRIRGRDTKKHWMMLLTCITKTKL
mmetsp:Transcript_23291/g.31856  ORF Transcript_23291/g.31856 Transcript_23291/m.31856 type:complete len:96 (-) Transcript_23291:60-347(-)